jgi:hypothetical protein
MDTDLASCRESRRAMLCVRIWDLNPATVE